VGAYCRRGNLNMMCAKKKLNKSTHLCEDKTVKAKAQRRSVRTIGRPCSNMAEEEGSSASMSIESEKDTSNFEYLSKTPAIEENEDEDIDVG
jgi:hypothetical protein